MGERVAIDDFGTGHSSLVYLQRLPIDEIKVDRSFVMNLATVPSDAVIVRSTIDLAHNLGLTVVAEGVEDEVALEHADRVRLRQRPGLPVQPPAPGRGADRVAGASRRSARRPGGSRRVGTRSASAARAAGA